MDKDNRASFHNLHPRNWSESTKAIAGATALVGAATAISIAQNTESTTVDSMTIQTEIVDHDSLRHELLADVCPTLDDGELLEAQRTIGGLNNSSNPANPDFARGQQIDIPSSLYCDGK